MPNFKQDVMEERCNLRITQLINELQETIDYLNENEIYYSIESLDNKMHRLYILQSQINECKQVLRYHKAKFINNDFG